MAPTARWIAQGRLRLTEGSPFRRAGLDGADVGVDDNGRPPVQEVTAADNPDSVRPEPAALLQPSPAYQR